MNPVPASVKAPRLPQVNLVPPELALKKARGRQRAIAMVLILVFVLGLGAAAVVLETVKGAAEDELALKLQERDEIQAEIALYSDVPRVTALLDNSRAARSYAGATEIDMALFFESFLAQLPPDSVFDSIGYERTTVNANGPQGTTPLSRPDLGQVTFSGWTPTVPNVALLATRLEAVAGIESVRVTVATRALEESSIEGDDEDREVVYNFTIAARINVDALTRRFAPDSIEQVEETTEGAIDEGEEA